MTDKKDTGNMQARQRQRRRQRGSVAVTSILFMTLIIGGSLGAIDLARYNVAQLRMTNALDAAVISAGRNLANHTPESENYVSDQWVNDARAFFYANMPSTYLGTRNHTLSIDYEDIRSDDDARHRVGQQMSMSAQADLPLISTGYLKKGEMGLAAQNQAIRRNRSDLEVVLVMDNSGSMDDKDKGSSKTRMQHLQESANLLIDMVLGAAEANNNSRTFIGLVPFTHVVNVGNSEVTRDWLTPAWSNSPYVTTDVWKGCITEPRPVNSLPIANVAPENNGPGYFRPLYRSRTTDRRFQSDIPHSNTATLAAKFTPVPLGFRQPSNPTRPDLVGNDNGYVVPAYKTTTSGWWNPTTSYYLTLSYITNPGWCNDSLKVRFLTDTISELKSSITSMTSEGGTAVPAGLLWGWRMLHPSWSGDWGTRTVALEDGGSAKMPRPAHRDLTKVLILLTDGANSVAGNITTDEGFSYSVNYNDSSKTNRTKSGSIDSSHGISHAINNHNSLNDTNAELTPEGGDSTNRLDAFTRTLCTNIKNPDDPQIPGGIKIYTIALGPASDADLMEDCASPNGFHNASNVNNLTDAFESIAGDLMELRLTQ